MYLSCIVTTQFLFTGYIFTIRCYSYIVEIIGECHARVKSVSQSILSVKHYFNRKVGILRYFNTSLVASVDTSKSGISSSRIHIIENFMIFSLLNIFINYVKRLNNQVPRIEAQYSSRFTILTILINAYFVCYFYVWK